MFLLWVITILSSGTELRFLRDHLYYKGSLCASSVLGGTFQLPNQNLLMVFEIEFLTEKQIYESKINIPLSETERKLVHLSLFFKLFPEICLTLTQCLCNRDCIS